MILDAPLVELQLQYLAEILERLERVARALAGRPEHHETLIRIMKVVGSVCELREDFWDVDPSLVDASHLPSADTDLSKAAFWLKRGDPEKRSDLIKEMLAHAPRSTVYRVTNARSDDERVEILCDWWDSVKIPFLAIDSLDRELDEKRRWRRVVAAKALEAIGVGPLLDATNADVSPEAVARWRAERHSE